MVSFSNVESDFDGDRKTDFLQLDNRLTGENFRQIYWHVLGGQSGYSITQWGAINNNEDGYVDFLVPDDYDGDGKTDIAIIRDPNIGIAPPVGVQWYWYILHSSTGTYEVVPWGLSINQSSVDYIASADYDGDGKTDIAIARSTSAGLIWWILQSTGGVRVERFGGGGGSAYSDTPVPADYDGDNKADLAVLRTPTAESTMTWYIQQSTDGNWNVARLGNKANDIPVLGDYDGDRKTDIAVVSRQGDFPTYNWRWINSSDGSFHSVHWGQMLDTPVQGDYDGDGKTDLAVYRPNGNCENFSNYWINGSSVGSYIVPFGGCGTSALHH